MAIEVIGFDGDVDEVQWARQLTAAARAGHDEVVFTGMTLSAGAGTREVTLSTGRAFMGGLWVEVQTPETLALAANSTGSTRVPQVVLESDWGADPGTVTLKELAPGETLTKAEGVIWQMRVGTASVANGATVATNLVSTKPLPGKGRLFKTRADADTILGTKTDGQNCASLDIDECGRPYILDVRGQLRVAADRGYARVSLTVNGATLIYNYSGGMTTENGSQPVSVGDYTDPMTGPATVKMHVAPENVSPSTLGWGGGLNNFLRVRQIYI